MKVYGGGKKKQKFYLFKITNMSKLKKYDLSKKGQNWFLTERKNKVNSINM